MNENGRRIVKNLVFKGWPIVGGNKEIIKKVLHRKNEIIKRLIKFEKLLFIILLFSLLNKKKMLRKKEK